MPSFHKEGLIMYAGISQGRVDYLAYYIGYCLPRVQYMPAFHKEELKTLFLTHYL